MFVVAVVLLFTLLAVLWLRRAVPDNDQGLTTLQLSLAFAFKVLMGCAYGYIFLVKYDGDDTWWLHDFTLRQTALLKKDPAGFFTEMNPSLTFNNDNGLAVNGYYYLAYLETWILTKPMALLNLVSGGNYYINIVFFNLPLFFGHYWLYQMIRQHFIVPRLPLYFAVFLVPPVVFWLSGFRADGPLFFLVMLTLRECDRFLKQTKISSIIIGLVSLTGILILRSVILIVLLPSLASWIISVKISRKPILVYVAVYGSCVLLFLGSTVISPGRNAASIIVGRQQAFFELVGNTRFNLDTLKPDAISFAKVLPQAINNSFLRPYPWEASGALQYATVLETLLFLTLILICFRYPVPQWKQVINHPFTLALIFTGIFLYILTGFIVPFPGAIVRYKIIGEVFFFAVLVTCIRWKSLPGTH